MGQQAQSLDKRISKTVKLGYWSYVPSAYGRDATVRWPLILFLHGMGERGSDLEMVKKHGIPKIADQSPDLPYLAVSPQCPANSVWTEQTDALDVLLKDVARQYSVDPDRVYLTGLSMGGFGTWHLAATYPRRFAAIVPICGGALPVHGFPERIAVLKDVPVWAFHGAKDEVVPLAETTRLVEVLQRVGGNVRLTVYPEAGHDSWTATYANPELYTWLLAQTRPGKTRR